MLASGEITKRLFIWGICAIAVIPRQHIDRTRCSIGGGDISHSFRKILLVSVVLNAIRLICKLLGVTRWFCDALGVIQIVSLSFLCFLTPYILQTWLATRINLGGRPGANLMLPLYLTALLSVSGVALSRLVHPNLWFLNRLANVVTGPPVLKTLKQFNSVTSIGGHHAGRGSILCQTLVVVEWWHMITMLLCAIGFALLNTAKPSADYTLWETMLQAFRNFAFTSGWTRVLAHAIFINLLDELYLTSQTTSSGGVNGAASGEQASSRHGMSSSTSVTTIDTELQALSKC